MKKEGITIDGLVIPGDKVGVEMSPYDLTRGRIYKRY